MQKLPDYDSESFEFERKFWVRELPDAALAEPSATLIVQSYVIADAGSCLRDRLGLELPQSELLFHKFGGSFSEIELVNRYAGEFHFASVGVKVPSLGGTRYEKEMTIAPEEAVVLVRSGTGNLIAKQRHGLFTSGDGWNIDVFCGSNYPLIIAECERSSPVTKLVIPCFCAAEVTDDMRFTNDSLASNPFSRWSNSFVSSVTREGPGFRKDLD